MFKVENINTQVHSVVLTIILCTFHTLPQLMKLLQRKSCPFSNHFLFALQRVHTLMSSMTCWVTNFSIQSCQFLHRYTIKGKLSPDLCELFLVFQQVFCRTPSLLLCMEILL